MHRLLFIVCFVFGLAANWWLATTLADEIDEQVTLAMMINATCWYIMPTPRQKVIRREYHGI